MQYMPKISKIPPVLVPLRYPRVTASHTVRDQTQHTESLNNRIAIALDQPLCENVSNRFHSNHTIFWGHLSPGSVSFSAFSHAPICSPIGPELWEMCVQTGIGRGNAISNCIQEYHSFPAKRNFGDPTVRMTYENEYQIIG